VLQSDWTATIAAAVLHVDPPRRSRAPRTPATEKVFSVAPTGCPESFVLVPDASDRPSILGLDTSRDRPLSFRNPGVSCGAHCSRTLSLEGRARREDRHRLGSRELDRVRAPDDGGSLLRRKTIGTNENEDKGEYEDDYAPDEGCQSPRKVVDATKALAR